MTTAETLLAEALAETERGVGRPLTPIETATVLCMLPGGMASSTADSHPPPLSPSPKPRHKSLPCTEVAPMLVERLHAPAKPLREHLPANFARRPANFAVGLRSSAGPTQTSDRATAPP
jgi:hypothetical protein